MQSHNQSKLFNHIPITNCKSEMMEYIYMSTTSDSDWDDMDEKLAEQLTFEAIDNEEGKDRSHFSININELSKIDEKFRINNKDDMCINSVMMCCEGDFCGDKPKIKEHKTILFCTNDYCNKINHLL
eukprot:302888_1